MGPDELQQGGVGPEFGGGGVEPRDLPAGLRGRHDHVSGDGLDAAEPAVSMAPEYIIEPSPEAVLNQVLYGFTEVQILQAIFESLASEHSARMVAMRNATDAAGELIDTLTLTYNKARQEGITTELMDIIGGSAALEA